MRTKRPWFVDRDGGRRGGGGSCAPLFIVRLYEAKEIRAEEVEWTTREPRGYADSATDSIRFDSGHGEISFILSCPVQ